MAGTLVPSDSTQAMASLMSAYGDDEGDEESVHDRSRRMSAQPADETASSPDTKTEPSGAHFISDDEDAHHSPEDSDPVPHKTEQDTKSLENRPVTVTSKRARTSNE